MTDEQYMERCLQLAALGRGHVSPNPMVGAVIVHDGKVIGEGFHRKCGEAHAEVNAIRSVKNQELLKESTLYVSLEPCSHWGKTPPCSKLIIEKGIPRVVVGVLDPFFEVSGRGIRMMRNAGVEVKVGVLEQACLALNKSFFTVQQKQRPYVILKWAQSADGFMDRHRTPGSDEKPLSISDEVNSIMVHKLRSEVDAIMVGTTTVLKDNPKLSVRKWDGSHPTRIFLDRTLRIPVEANILDGSIPTVVITAGEVPADRHPHPGVTYVTLPFDGALLKETLRELLRFDIQTVLVEGGAELLQSFIDSALWDEARVEIGSVQIGDGVKAPCIRGVLFESQHFGDSLVLSYGKN